MLRAYTAILLVIHELRERQAQLAELTCGGARASHTNNAMHQSISTITHTAEREQQVKHVPRHHMAQRLQLGVSPRQWGQ